jgi:2-C-methyl-D-erythritol 4-phosphate cytidylyltransferase
MGASLKPESKPESKPKSEPKSESKSTAIIVAAGQGKRMGGDVAKQFLPLHQKPVLYYAIKAFEEAPEIHSIIVVTGGTEMEYVKTEIIRRYGFQSVEAVVAGGKERYHSVYNGLQAAWGCDYVFIHDGARPLIDAATIARAGAEARKYQAVAVGIPARDTVKIADREGYIETTPRRELVWTVQTPQVFSYPLVMRAYESLLKEESALPLRGITVTDDAMVVETYTETRVKLVEGSYRNLKITTPEDLRIAAVL